MPDGIFNFQLSTLTYFFIIAMIIPKKPSIHTIGASVIRRKLNTSGLNSVVVELPAISAKPTMINNTETAMRM